ncbi:MAG: hypothetical protein AB8C84_01205 [Oligoflexales bacterium]
MNFFYLFVSFFYSLSAFSIGQHDVVEVMYAVAYKQGTNDVLYKEEHQMTYREGKIFKSKTLYKDSYNSIIASMISDYSRSVMLPSCVFKDFKAKKSEGLIFRNGKYFIFSEEEKGKRKEKLLEKTKEIFSCQGWHYYLVNRLDEIGEEGLEFNLIFPSQLDYYAFDLKKEGGSENLLSLSLQFSNWFIRIFAPRLDLVYDTQKKKLVSYQGPSNLMDAEGEVQYVKVIYQ